MDLKGWRKIKEDNKSCTLVHPKGHTMTIAVKALPRLMQEQIKRLQYADGGAVMPDKEKARQAWDGAQNGEMRRLKGYLGLGDDEKKEKPVDQTQTRQNYADGDQVEQDPGSDTVQESPDTVKVSAPTQPAPPPVVVNNILPNGGGAPAVSAPPPAPKRDAINFEPKPQAPNPNAVPPVEQTQLKNSLPKDLNLMRRDQTADLPGAVEQVQEAGKKQAEIDAATAADQAQATKENMADINAIALRRQQNFEDLTEHADNLAKNIHEIDPKHFQNSMSGDSKVATGIGLFLGGLGVPFGGHNYAEDFLNKQIDRDIEAQKATNETQKTIWGAYKELYGDSVVADNMTAVALKDYMAERMKQAALKQGTPQAWANYQKWLGNYMQERQEKLIDNAGRLGTLQTGRGGGGAPKAAGEQPPEKASGAEGEKHPLKGNILPPDAADRFERIKYKLKAMGREGDLPEIQKQFTNADQADKALASVNDTFMNLWKNANASGVSGRVHRGISPHAVGAVGAGLGAAAGAPFLGIGALPGAAAGAATGEAIGHAVAGATNTDENRRYDSEQSSLKGYISSALKGTNIGSGDIDDIVSKNSPEYGDSDKTAANKLKTIREFIKNHTETSLLKTWGLAK